MAKKKGKRANGEGTIRLRKDGRWEAIITTGRDPLTGKLIRKSFFGKTQSEAKAKRDDFLLQIKTGTYLEPHRTTLGSWINSWLEMFVKPTVRMSTYSKYMINFRTHVISGLGSVELQKLTTEHIQKFYNEKATTLSSSVIAILHQIVNKSLKQAVKQKLILTNPAEYTVRPSVKYKEITPLNASEVEQYLNAAKDDRLYAAFLLDITTGLRRGELLALRWSNVDLTTGVLTVSESLNRVETYSGKTTLLFSDPKTSNSKREIPLLSNVIQELKAHRARQLQERLLLGEGYQDNDLVFGTGLGTPIEPRGLLRKHKAILKKAGLREELRIHDLRHTFGTMLAQAGENPRNLQLLLGHADIKTTLGTYCHSTLEDKKRTIQTLGKIIKA